MAATSVTILKEYIAKETYTDHDYELFTHALDYSGGLGEIGATLYYQLHDAAQEKQAWLFKERLQLALDIMTRIWDALGKPERHEHWNDKLNAMYHDGYHLSDDRQCFVHTRTGLLIY